VSSATALTAFGRVALRVADDQLDLAAVDAACIVDLGDGKLGAAIDADARGRTRPVSAGR